MMSQNSQFERAAARKLNADEEVVLEVQKVEARHGALAEVGLKLFSLKDALALAPHPSGDERIDDAFRFAEDQEIGGIVKMRAWRRIGGADANGLAEILAVADDRQSVDLLRQHAAGHHQIGPEDVPLVERFSIPVDEP